MNNILSSVDSLFDIPSPVASLGINILKTILTRYTKRKTEAAREILLKEIEEGELHRIPEDDLIFICYRYSQAAINGAAKYNLKLLARLIKGLCTDEDLLPDMYVTEFHRYSNVLANLSRDEIQVLATLYKFKKPNNNEWKCYSDAEKWLSGDQVDGKQGKKIMTSSEFKAITASLVRTGLVDFAPLTLNGNITMQLSPLFFKMIRLLDESIWDTLGEIFPENFTWP